MTSPLLCSPVKQLIGGLRQTLASLLNVAVRIGRFHQKPRSWDARRFVGTMCLLRPKPRLPRNRQQPKQYQPGTGYFQFRLQPYHPIG